MPHSYHNLIYHIVFGTKEFRPWLDADVAPRVHEYLGGTVRAVGGVSLGINGVADHVHVLARLRQDKAVSDVLRDIKANSSGWIHRTFPELDGFAWQGGYGAFTVSKSQVRRVQEYIGGQAEHHKRTTFQEEFVKLLQAHGVEFDERYLWE